MHADIKTEWLRRLRSGEIKQGRSFLHCAYTGEMCCLGVLCEMAVEAGVVQRHEPPGRSFYEYGVGGHYPLHQSSAMPDEVAVWAGLEADGVAILPPHAAVEGHSLAGLNDSGSSFAAIAEVIELWF